MTVQARTAQILSILESFHVPTAFFDLGIHNAAWPSMLADEVAAGFRRRPHLGPSGAHVALDSSRGGRDR